MNNPWLRKLDVDYCYSDEIERLLKEGEFVQDADIKRSDHWKKEKQIYGFDSTETWNLDCVFVMWVYTRVQLYDKVCNVATNVEFFEYKGNEYSFQEGINMLLDLSKKMILDMKDNGEYNNEDMDELCDLWKVLVRRLWW